MADMEALFAEMRVRPGVDFRRRGVRAAWRTTRARLEDTGSEEDASANEHLPGDGRVDDESVRPGSELAGDARARGEGGRAFPRWMTTRT